LNSQFREPAPIVGLKQADFLGSRIAFTKICVHEKHNNGSPLGK
jgi:hypothetical protein